MWIGGGAMTTFNMKSFSGPFASMLELYISQKQALGYDYTGGYNIFMVFDKFSKNYNVTNNELTEDIVTDWAKKRLNESETYRSARIYHLQHFATFLNTQGFYGYIAPRQIYHFPQHNAYIFTRDEIKRIFEVLDKMDYSPCSPYKHISFPLLYRMLYGCGFRISELTNLKLENVDIEKGIIHVINAKNGNERPVPMSNSLSILCRDYTKALHKENHGNHPFFYKKDGSSYSVSNMEKNFREILWLAGIPYYGKKTGPRLHDLRHTFICHRLNQWAREDIDITTMLPVLSKYVGHSSIKSTEYYLKLTSEAYPDIIDKMEYLTGYIFPEVGGDVYED